MVFPGCGSMVIRVMWLRPLIWISQWENCGRKPTISLLTREEAQACVAPRHAIATRVRPHVTPAWPCSQFLAAQRKAWNIPPSLTRRTSAPSNLRREHPRMRAFSYVASLWVTWQRHRSHQSIRKHVLMRRLTLLYVSQNGSYCRSKFYIARIGIFDVFGQSCDLPRIP